MAGGFKNKAQAVWAFIKRTAIRVFNYLKVAKMEWIVMISVFIVDLVAKSLVENFLAFDETVPMIPYFLNAHKVHNYSAAFGSSWLRSWMGDIGARIFFCVFAVAASVAFILVLIRNKGKSRVFRIAVALFVAGAMGNCIDRMALGYVRDFIEFEYFGLTIAGSKTWAYIFNIADVALVTGVLLIVFYFLVLYRDNDKKKIEFTIDSEPTDEVRLSDSTRSGVAPVTASGDETSADKDDTEHNDENKDTISEDTATDSTTTENTENIDTDSADDGNATDEVAGGGGGD
ncbi:MAG: signal peptidase II [Clostridiales bacterium]|nr:signal peptidase II [Clostridiales bacterium]